MTPTNDFAALVDKLESEIDNVLATECIYGALSQESGGARSQRDDARAALLAYGAGVERERNAELARRKFMQQYGSYVGWGIVSPDDAPSAEDMENPASAGVTVRCMSSPYATRQFGYAYYADHLNADGTQNREAAERAAIDMAMDAVAAYELGEAARREQTAHEAETALATAQHFARKGAGALTTRHTEARES